MYAIKNRWLSRYLCDGDDQLNYGASVADNTYKWVVENIGSSQKELRNAGWWSAQWQLIETR